MAKVKINKQKRIIWTNNDYDEWLEAMKEEYGSEFNDDEFGYDRYAEDCSMYIDDERINLNKEVDGYIVAFASLGIWSGRVNGAKVVGVNVRDILYSDCDYVTWFCDPYNVKCESIHHDGTNYILYRVAKDRETAERLVDKIAYHDMTEEEFRRATKSLRPYVAQTYGW